MLHRLCNGSLKPRNSMSCSSLKNRLTWASVAIPVVDSPSWIVEWRSICKLSITFSFASIWIFSSINSVVFSLDDSYANEVGRPFFRYFQFFLNPKKWMHHVNWLLKQNYKIILTPFTFVMQLLQSLKNIWHSKSMCR